MGPWRSADAAAAVTDSSGCRRWSALLSLLLVAVALAGCQEKSQETFPGLLWRFSEEDIESMQITTCAGSTTLTRGVDEWRDSSDRVVQGRSINELLQVGSTLVSNRTLEPDFPLEHYGLASPVAHIRFRGSLNRTITLGDRGPIRGNVYGMVDGDPRVHLLPGLILEDALDLASRPRETTGSEPCTGGVTPSGKMK